MLTYVFVRAADARPYELHDLIPSNTKWKLLVFTGDIGVGNTEQIQKVSRLAEDLGGASGFLNRYPESAFDILTICATQKEHLNYTDVPEVLRPHWSRLAFYHTPL